MRYWSSKAGPAGVRSPRRLPIAGEGAEEGGFAPGQESHWGETVGRLKGVGNSAGTSGEGYKGFGVFFSFIF